MNDPDRSACLRADADLGAGGQAVTDDTITDPSVIDPAVRDGDAAHTPDTAVAPDTADAPNTAVAPDTADLQALWALAPTPVAIADADGRLRHVSRAWSTLLGWRLADLVGRPVPSLVDPADRPDVEAHLARLPRSAGTPTWFEARCLEAPGGSRWMTWHVQYLPERDRIYLRLRDISQRRRAEAVLRASEERFRLAMEHAPIGMVLIDLDGSWIRANAAMARLLGRSQKELTGDVFASVSHPDDVDVSNEQMLQLLAGEIDRYTLEKRYVRPDGEVVWGEVTVSLVPGDDGTPISVIGQVIDVTARKQAEQELHRVVAELERSNHDLARFAAVVSHDLKSPLTTVMGFLELLDRHHGEGLSSDARDWLGRAHEQAGRLTETVDALLTLARVGRDELDLEDVELGEVVSEVLEALAPKLEQAGASVDVGPLPRVRGDHAQLRVLLQNLVANAVRFRAASRPLRIVIDAVRDGSWWQVRVEDNGRGFDPADREAIFELFARGRDGEQLDGAGIGLATCRQIVTRHGGSIRAEPLDPGARFVVHLPAEG